MKQNVKPKCKFWLVFYPSWYYPLGTGSRFFLFSGQNPLSVMKVICQQSLKTWRKEVLIPPKLKFIFKSSTWIVEVIELDSHVLVYWILWAKYGQWCYRFKFFEEIRLHWLFNVGFGEIRFLKWHYVTNSNSWFLAILKEFSGLPLFKLILFFLKIKYDFNKNCYFMCRILTPEC